MRRLIVTVAMLILVARAIELVDFHIHSTLIKNIRLGQIMEIKQSYSPELIGCSIEVRDIISAAFVGVCGYLQCGNNPNRDFRCVPIEDLTQ